MGGEVTAESGRWISGAASLGVGLLLLSLASPVYAGGPRRGLAVFGALGFNGNADWDEKVFRGQTSVEPVDDVEDILGFGAVYEVNPGVRNVAAGGRFFLSTGKLEDSDDELLSVDGGVWGRYYQPVGENLLAFGAGAAGLTYGQLTVDDDSDNQVSGIGYHIVLGGGLTYGLSNNLGFFGGLFYEYQGFPSLSGEYAGADLEFKDSEISFFLLTAGVLLDI